MGSEGAFEREREWERGWERGRERGREGRREREKRITPYTGIQFRSTNARGFFSKLPISTLPLPSPLSLSLALSKALTITLSPFSPSFPSLSLSLSPLSMSHKNLLSCATSARKTFNRKKRNAETSFQFFRSHVAAKFGGDRNKFREKDFVPEFWHCLHEVK